MKDDLQKSDSCGLKSERKKILTSSTCSLACLSTNLGAFCPMVVHLPSEKSILPYFSGPRGVAISVPFPEVRNRKGAESGLEEDKGESLEGKQVWVGGEEDGELKTLKMLEVRTTGSLDLMILVNAALDLLDISA